jgi:hypothetical protein
MTVHRFVFKKTVMQERQMLMRVTQKSKKYRIIYPYIITPPGRLHTALACPTSQDTLASAQYIPDYLLAMGMDDTKPTNPPTGACSKLAIAMGQKEGTLVSLQISG